MKYKVKFRVNAPGKDSKKVAINLDDDIVFVFGTQSLGLEKDLCSIVIHEGSPTLKSLSSDGKINNRSGESFDLRQGDVFQANGCTVEFLEVPYVEVAVAGTQFLDIANLVVPQQSATKVELPKQRPEPTQYTQSPAAPKPEPAARRETHNHNHNQNHNHKHKNKKKNRDRSIEERAVEAAARSEATAKPVVQDTIKEIKAYRESVRETEVTRFAQLTQARTETTISVVVVSIVSGLSATISHSAHFVVGMVVGLALMLAFCGFLHSLRRVLRVHANFHDYVAFMSYPVFAALPVAWAVAQSPIVALVAFVLGLVAFFVAFNFHFKPDLSKLGIVGGAFTAGAAALFHISLAGHTPPMTIVARAPVEVPAETAEMAIATEKALAEPQAAPVQVAPPIQTQAVAQQQAPVPQQQVPVAQAPVAQAPVAQQQVPDQVQKQSVAIAVPDPLAVEQFFTAIKAGNLGVVRDLISHRAVDASFTLEKGTTALMHSAAYGHLNVVKYLVSQRANLNAQDPNGTTALMWAVYRGHKDIAQFLLQKGANPTLKRDDGDRAVDIARRWRRHEIIALFEPDYGDANAKRGLASQPQKKSTYSPAKKPASRSRPNQR